MAFPARIYLDTCMLPAKRGVRAGMLSPLTALAAKHGSTVHVPQLVLDEYRHLRSVAAEAAIEKLKSALRDATGHLDLPSVYIPTVDEVVNPLIIELESIVRLIPLDGDDAREALTREAERTRPARAGKGGRDSAIWLATRRHHMQSEGLGCFMTSNREDFADPGDRDRPHPQLLKDLGDSADRFEFSFAAYHFLENHAPAVIFDKSAEAASVGHSSVPAELELHILTHAMDLLGVQPNVVQLLEPCSVTAVHQLDGDSRLLKVEGLMFADAMIGSSISFVIWAEQDRSDVHLLAVESISTVASV